MSTNARHVLQAVQNTIWAIDEAKLREIAGVVANRFRGKPELTASEVAAMKRDKTPMSRNGAIAVLPLYGTISQRMGMMEAMSGGTSTEQFGKAFTELVNDDTIAAIVIDIDSPGGSVAGVSELAAKIRAARGTKPIIALCNSLMASAAYWIGSAADKIVMTKLGAIGSQNAIMVRVDMTAKDEADGVKYYFISGGGTDNKAEGSPHFPVSEEELTHLQANVDVANDAFMADVASNRGISIEQVRESYGQGRIYFGQLALDAGLADEIGTLESVIDELRGPQSRTSSRARANTTIVPLAANDGSVADALVRVIDATEALAATNVTAALSALGENIRTSASGTTTTIELHTGATAGAPATSEPADPSPAPEARSVPMSENTGTAAAGAVDVKAEAKRVSELFSLAAAHELEITQAQAWADNGTSVTDAKAAILDMKREKNASAAAVRPGATREHEKPFASFGEQLQAVAVQGGAVIPGIDKAVALGRLGTLQAAATGHSATVGSDGGFLVGKQTEQGLMKRAYDQSVLASRCNITEIGENADSLEWMGIKESSRATGSRYGGIRFYRTAEAETVTASKLGLEKQEIRLEDMMAVTYITGRLMQDATALQGEVSTAFGDEGSFVLDDEIFRGTGVGQCYGIVNHPSLVTISKETSQVADTVVAENLWKIWARERV